MKRLILLSLLASTSMELYASSSSGSGSSEDEAPAKISGYESQYKSGHGRSIAKTDETEAIALKAAIAESNKPAALAKIKEYRETAADIYNTAQDLAKMGDALAASQYAQLGYTQLLSEIKVYLESTELNPEIIKKINNLYEKIEQQMGIAVEAIESKGFQSSTPAREALPAPVAKKPTSSEKLEKKETADSKKSEPEASKKSEQAEKAISAAKKKASDISTKTDSFEHEFKKNSDNITELRRISSAIGEYLTENQKPNYVHIDLEWLDSLKTTVDQRIAAKSKSTASGSSMPTATTPKLAAAPQQPVVRKEEAKQPAAPATAVKASEETYAAKLAKLRADRDAFYAKGEPDAQAELDFNIKSTDDIAAYLKDHQSALATSPALKKMQNGLTHTRRIIEEKSEEISKKNRDPKS